MRLSDISREHINCYKVERAKETTIHGKHPEPGTINRELQTLRTLFSLAMQEGKVEHNPVSGRGVLYPLNNKVARILSRIEEARLNEECKKNSPPYLYNIVFAAFQTGMRRGELLGLKWDNVNLANGTITITVENSKSKKERTIPINKNLYVLFKSLKNEGPYVFSGKKQIKDIKKSFNTAKKLANIDLKFRFHDIRHTVASRLVTEYGVDLVTVASILGHSNLKMLERYAHTRREIELSALDALCEVPDTSQLHNYCTIEENEEKEEIRGNHKMLEIKAM